MALAAGRSWNGIYGDTDATLEIWNIQIITLAEERSAPKYSLYSVAYSPDGRLLACAGGPDGSVLVYDASAGAMRATLRSHESSVLSVAFSPDGTHIASGGDKTVAIWQIAEKIYPNQY